MPIYYFLEPLTYGSIQHAQTFHFKPDSFEIMHRISLPVDCYPEPPEFLPPLISDLSIIYSLMNKEKAYL
jgi:hypothetical protein